MSERQVYVTVEDALRTYPWWPEANLGVIREKIAELDITEICTPPGRGYIGLRATGYSKVVQINFGFIYGMRDEALNRSYIELPINQMHQGERKSRAGQEADPCPNCGMVLPLSGYCENCN